VRDSLDTFYKESIEKIHKQKQLSHHNINILSFCLHPMFQVFAQYKCPWAVSSPPIHQTAHWQAKTVKNPKKAQKHPKNHQNQKTPCQSLKTLSIAIESPCRAIGSPCQ